MCRATLLPEPDSPLRKIRRTSTPTQRPAMPARPAGREGYRRGLFCASSATAGFLVCRAMLRQGRPYEEAVARFSPYSEIRDPNPGARESLRILIQRARENRTMAFLFVNNRLEGNSPLTIMAVTEPD